MDKFFKLIIKKILESKVRLVLMAINFAVGVFLFSLIMTIGVNLLRNNTYMIEDMVHLRQIRVNATEFDQTIINGLRKHNRVTRLQVELNSNFVLSSFMNQEIITSPIVTRINQEFDIIINRLEYGELLRNEQDILISRQLLELNSINAEDALGEQIILTNGLIYIERIIVGIFDNNIEDSFTPFAVMKRESEIDNISQLLLEVDRLDAVSFIDNYIRQLGMIPNSHISEIRQLTAANRIIIVGFSFVGILLLITSMTILQTTLKVSVKSKYGLVAMLRTQGYPNTRLRLIILVEIIILAIIAFTFGFTLYGLSLAVLPQFLNMSFINMQFIDIFSFNIVAILITVSSSLITLTMVAIKPIKMLQNCDVVNLLKEGEQ